jgi:hypothetical protein
MSIRDYHSALRKSQKREDLKVLLDSEEPKGLNVGDVGC